MKTTVPAKPPEHPAFDTILRSVIRVQEERGPAEAAAAARRAAENILAQAERDEEREAGSYAARLCKAGMNAMDLQGLVQYLRAYADALTVPAEG